MLLSNQYYNKKGKLNSSRLKKLWIKNNDSNFYKRIINYNKDNNKLSFIEKLYLYINKIKQPFCFTCGKETKFLSINRGYQKYCSKKCAQSNNLFKNLLLIKRKIFNILKYGYDNPAKNNKIKAKLINTLKKKTKDKLLISKIKKEINNIIKYGYKCSLQNQKVKEKGIRTNLFKYGVKYITQTKEHKQKIFNTMKNKTKKEKLDINLKKEKTNLVRYGVSHPMKNDIIKNKFKSSINKKNYNYYFNRIKILYKIDISFQDYIKLGLKNKYKLICKKCNNIFYDYLSYNGNIPKCSKCYPYIPSKIENNIIEDIKKMYNGIIVKGDKKILNGKELDIYLPNNKLAIEYNGLMWHSIGKHKSSKFNNYLLESEIKNKHIYKTEECRKQGIQLLHIFENEWLDKNKQEIWKNIITNKLGYTKHKIYGRNTYIKLVPNELSRNFLSLYHLQGNTPAKLKIGLFDEKTDELLSIMTFGKSRFDKKVDWELLRFTTKNGYNIIGGASKIFKYFVNNYLENGQSIKTYADLRFSNGDIYKKLGFKLVGQSKPNYFYFKNGSYKLESRQSYQRHKLKDRLENFNPNLSESQNMYNNNYRKIYDCGNLVFVYKKEKEYYR